MKSAANYVFWYIVAAFLHSLANSGYCSLGG